MAYRKRSILNLVFISACIFHDGAWGKTVPQLLPHSRILRSVGQRSTSTINESSQQTGSGSGFVNSTAEGNGQPGSATAYAWQGGQTSAQGTQTATADQNGNLNAETTGSSNCQQGYTGSGSGNNANSNGNAMCNTTNTQSGTHATQQKGEKGQGDAKFGWLPIQFAPPIQMNYSVGMIGEAQSGQIHNSASNVGGEAGGLMNIFAGGFAGTPQGSMTFSHSAFDPQGNAINANQSLLTTPGLNSEEHTMVGLTGNNVGHDSGGLAHVFGLGTNTSQSYNSHAVEDEKKKGRGIVGIQLE